MLLHVKSEKGSCIKENVSGQKLQAGYKENRKNLSKQDIQTLLLETDK
jgi:hypothetical protein